MNQFSCPRSAVSVPDNASHARMILSHEPETMWVPSGENVTDVTTLSCPRAGSVSTPNSASNTWMVWLSEPETMRVPSGENATDVTSSLCSRSAGSYSMLNSGSYTQIAVSVEPEKIRVPSRAQRQHRCVQLRSTVLQTRLNLKYN